MQFTSAIKIVLLGIMSCLLACGPDYGIVGHDEFIVEVEVEVPGDPVGNQWVDSFIQPGGVDGVDILWVIDTSGSMIVYQSRLLDGIEAMLNALPSSDWRLAMIPNDPNAASNENQFPLVPGDDIDDAEDMFESMGGGPWEEGFDATYEYVVNNSYSSTWMRYDAALLVVFVSDEEDQSNGYFSNVSDFTAWYGTTRIGPVYLSSIVTQDPSVSVCSTPPAPVFVGDRYMEATNAYNGVIVDICADDWSAGVADASHQVDPYEWYELSYKPIDDSIRVFIDQVPNSDWTYQASDNTVYFTTIPEAGSWVEVVYRHEETEHLSPPPV
tara:strand:+ start:1819 stop:2796 length:978 start_codon:yes stop_codon:yes gene_type:complete